MFVCFFVFLGVSGLGFKVYFRVQCLFLFSGFRGLGFKVYFRVQCSFFFFRV